MITVDYVCQVQSSIGEGSDCKHKEFCSIFFWLLLILVYLFMPYGCVVAGLFALPSQAPNKVCMNVCACAVRLAYKKHNLFTVTLSHIIFNGAAC